MLHITDIRQLYESVYCVESQFITCLAEQNRSGYTFRPGSRNVRLTSKMDSWSNQAGRGLNQTLRLFQERTKGGVDFQHLEELEGVPLVPGMSPLRISELGSNTEVIATHV